MSEITKVRATAAELRESVPMKDFEWEHPFKENTVVVATGQKLSPGHLFELDKPSLIRMYEDADTEDTDTTAEDTEVPDAVETAKNLQQAAGIVSLSLIDVETGERLYTERECLHFIPPEKLVEISTWAVEGARPRKKEGDPDADDADRFSEQPGEQTESDVADEG